MRHHVSRRVLPLLILLGLLMLAPVRPAGGKGGFGPCVCLETVEPVDSTDPVTVE